MKRTYRIIALSLLMVFVMALPVMAKPKAADPASLDAQMESIRMDMQSRMSNITPAQAADPAFVSKLNDHMMKQANKIIALDNQYIALTGQGSGFYRAAEKTTVCMSSVIYTKEGCIVPFASNKVGNDYYFHYTLVSNGLPLNRTEIYFPCIVTRGYANKTYSDWYYHSSADLAWPHRTLKITSEEPISLLQLAK